MKRPAHVLLVAVLFATAYAGEEGHRVTLWEARGEHNIVYLLGSIHMLRAGDHPLPSVVDRAYEDAEVLVMELDMDDLDPVAAQASFNETGVLRDGTTLADLMGDSAYAEAKRLAAAVDIPIDLLAQSEPWLAALTVEMLLLYRIGFDPQLGIEMTMTRRAAADGKAIEGLESVGEQLSFLDGLSPAAQRDMLLQSLEDGAAIPESVDDMIRAWRHGDTAALEEGLLAGIERHAELNEALVAGRNRRWAERIAELLDDDDDYLVVVGALHLVGENGVPRLLEAAGIPIRQLSESPSLR